MTLYRYSTQSVAGGTQNMEGTASARPPGIPKSMAAQVIDLFNCCLVFACD